MNVTPGKVNGIARAADQTQAEAMIRAKITDTGGGHQEGADIHADTLDALRAMLPARLTRWDRTMVMPADVVETWD